MRRAAIYARVSRAYKEDDERVTIEAQLADCEAYCLAHDYQVVKQYIDKDKYRVKGKLVGPSGTRKDRPAYLDLLKAARAGEFDVIIAWKEDRLYRGMYAALPLSEVLDECKNKLTVELVKETFDFHMLGIKAAIAIYPKRLRRDRMVMGRKVRMERGEVPGGPPRYGYFKNENNLLEINPAEASVVRQVYEWYVQGENNMEIRRRLNASGIKPRQSKIWSKAMVQIILTFPGYALGEYTTKLDDVDYTTKCPPIIPRVIWDKSIETRQHNKFYRGRNVKEDYLCRGMIVCPCGTHWTARTVSGPGQSGKSGYYGCTKKDYDPENISPDCPGTIGSKKLDDYVWHFVTTICHNPSIIQRAIDAKLAALREEGEDLEGEAKQLSHELEDIDGQRQWVIRQGRLGRITAHDVDKQLAEVDFLAVELRKRIGDNLAVQVVKQQVDHLKAWAEKYLRNIETGLEVLETDPATLTPDEQEVRYQALDAARFAEKFPGDSLAALRWAILEEKRRTIRNLVDQVLVVKGKDGKKLIIPQLGFRIPADFASLVYEDQSLDYVERARLIAEEVEQDTPSVD
ncbi:MAG: recombinase family protein [Chloroflexi bacterium]|nr:recombinase family protein [Chloroflexota bacterium]